MAVSGAQLEGGEHVSTGWAFSRHFLWWWLTAKAAATALNFPAPFCVPLPYPQLCSCPSHHPQKVIFNLDQFPDQPLLSSTNTVLAQLAGMNRREDRRLWQHHQKLLSWSPSPGASSPSFTPTYKLPRRMEYASDISHHKVVFFFYLCAALWKSLIAVFCVLVS